MNWYKESMGFPTASKKSLINAVIASKGTLIDDGYKVSCIAPEKHVWQSTETHEVSIWYERGWKKNEVYYELLQDVKNGVIPCSTPDCEWCQEPEGLPYGTNMSSCIVLNGILQNNTNI